jgi:orotidine-5'-phosphate decarboxylase
MATFIERLNAAIRSKQTPALVGLDPRMDQLPAEILERARQATPDKRLQMATAYEEFCVRIIDVVAPLVPAVKPQVAFFEECGPDGLEALNTVMRHARKRGLIVIADAKRGDIGSTAEGYAAAWLAGDDPEAAAWPADCLTINPFLGRDTLDPFVKTAKERNAGLYVLVKTSNPGSGLLQDRVTEGQTVSECLAGVVEQLAQDTAVAAERSGSIGAVVGATHPEQLAKLRALMPHVPLLIPGYGSQGGTSKDVASAFHADGTGALVNSSRGIIFASSRKEYRDRYSPKDWEKAVEQATREMIEDLSANTPAGALRR